MKVLELHSPIKIIQRSKGQTATAAAAYRSGTRLKDERTGEIHDYRKKEGIAHNLLLFPIGTPENIVDRQTLWNAAEKREKHPKAQTAREVEISFPYEFNEQQRLEAGYAIANLIVDRYNVAADFAFHQPSKKGDERNHHVHILFTNRSFKDGDWSKTKDLPFEFGRGEKGRAQAEVLNLRQNIADVLNQISVRDGLEIYIEHLSFEQRGLDREPTKHLGKDATQLERKGVQTKLGDENRAIKKRNANQQENEQLGKEIKYDQFYRETQDRRRLLMDQLEQQYGDHQRQSLEELTRLYKSVEQSRGILAFWRNITGRTRKDQERIEALQATLQNIEQRKQESFAAFEKDRQSRLEALKKEQDQSREQRAQTAEFTPDDEKAKLIAFLERENAIREQDYDQDFGLEQ